MITEQIKAKMKMNKNMDLGLELYLTEEQLNTFVLEAGKNQKLTLNINIKVI